MSAPSLPKQITVYEVGPRDGLQNEQSLVPTEAKIQFVNLLSDAGYRAIEGTSFVNPKMVPQMADAADVLQGIAHKSGVRYPVLVPNEKGMRRALEAGAREVALFTAASESFTKANINCSIQESLENFKPVIELAKQHGIRVRGYVSTALGCPYEGYVPESRVTEVAQALVEIGVTEISLGDTIGVGTPADVERVFGAVLEQIPPERLAAHFHDTRGTALVNVLTAMRMGISTIDSSAGGLGGCPFAPGASGNLATEDLLYMLDGMGIQTGVDIDKVAQASAYILGILGKPPSSKYLQAYLSQRAA